MKTILLALTLISSFAFAETATLTVEGMGCAGCKKMVDEKVCEDAVLKEKFESCKVAITDSKNHTGQITIVSKKDTKVDLAAVKAGVKSAGDEYKVTKEEIK